MISDDDGAVRVAPPVHIFSTWVEAQAVRARMLHGLPIPESLDAITGLLTWTETAKGKFEQTGRSFELAAARQARDADRFLRQWLDDENNPYLEERFFAMRSASRRKLQESDLFSTEDWIQDLTEVLQAEGGCPLVLPEGIELVGFVEFTSQESRLLEALEQRGVEVRHQSFDREASNGQVRAFLTPEDEWQAAVAWAKSRLDEGAQRLAIVMPASTTSRGTGGRRFRDLMNAVFHPVESSCLDDSSISDFYIPDAFALAECPVVKDALGLIRITLAGAERKLEFPLLSRWLLSRHWMESEWMARARLEIRLRKLGLFESSLRDVRRLAASEEWDDSLQGLVSAITDLPGTPGANFGVWFYEILEHWGWPGSCEDPTAVSDANSFVGLLERLDTMSFSDPSRALEAVEMMAADSRRSYGGGPLSPVQVLTPEVAIARQFEGVWVTGMDDANWPPPMTGNPYLPASARAQIPRMNPEGQLAYHRELTHRLSKSADQVVFSWSQDGGQGERNRSMLLPGSDCSEPDSVTASKLATAFWHHRGVSTDNHEPLVVVSEQAKGLPITLESEGRLPGGSGFFRLQAASPMGAYLRYRLSAEFPDAPSPLASPQYRGELMHQALRELYRQSVEAGRQPTFEEIPESVEAALIRLRARDKLTPSGFRAERQRLQQLLKEWLKLDNGREGIRVEAVEAARKLDCGGREISVRFDRLDRMADQSFFVLDYKSGGSPSRALKWTLSRMQEPQLPLYAVLLEDQGQIGSAGGIAFAIVRKGKCAYDGITGVEDGEAVKGIRKPGTRQLKAWDWPSLMAHWRSQIDGFTREILAGRADNCIYDAQIVEYSGLDLILRYSEAAGETDQGADDAI